MASDIKGEGHVQWYFKTLSHHFLSDPHKNKSCFKQEEELSLLFFIGGEFEVSKCERLDCNIHVNAS